jgi:hypothetical protein
MDSIFWLTAPALGPDVARCLVLTLPKPRPDAPPRRPRGRPAMIARRLLFARDREGRVISGAFPGTLDLDRLDLRAVCTALRDRAPGSRVRTARGTVFAGPDDAILAEFERTWRERLEEKPSSRPLRRAIAAFEAELDGALLDACPRGFPLRYRAYNWLCRQPAADRARVAQAVEAYPFIWSLLLLPNDPASAVLRERIRAAEPIARSLADLLQAQPWQLRALQRAFAAGHLDERGHASLEDLLACTRALDHLAPERVPATREGWSYLRRAVDQLRHKAWLRPLADAGFDALATGRGVPRFWQPFARKAGLRRQLSAIGDFYDYAALFPGQDCLPERHATDLRAVVEAHARWRAGVGPAVLAYYYDQALPEWLQQGVPAPWEIDELDDPAFTGSWAALLDAPVTIDGYTFVELATAQALREEGRDMRHCVASYAERCLRRGSHIFSVRTDGGERVSTLEVRQVAGAWRVAEHCGKANRVPPLGAVAAAARFVEGIPLTKAGAGGI